MFVTSKTKGEIGMTTNVAKIEDVKSIIEKLSTENKKYVIAVTNALLFSQENSQPRNLPRQPA